jgi:hypothetical protein
VVSIWSVALLLVDFSLEVVFQVAIDTNAVMDILSLISIIRLFLHDIESNTLPT